MRRLVMLTDLMKQHVYYTILSYDRSRSPEKLINLINQIDQFKCTYEVLTVPARRWRSVMRRLVMLADLIKHNIMLLYNRSRSPDTIASLKQALSDCHLDLRHGSLCGKDNK